MSEANFHVNGSNGAAPAPAPEQVGEQSPAASLETTLFKAGLITADQLGELVLERVQSGRPAAEIVVERGFVAPETLAQMLAAATPAADPAPAPVAEPLPAPAADPVPAAVPDAAPAPAAPVVAVAPPEAPPVPAPAPAFVAEAPTQAPIVAEPVEPATEIAPPPTEPLAEAPTAAAQPLPEAASAPSELDEAAAPQEPTVAEPPQQHEVEPSADAEAGDHGFSMGEVHYGIRIRLSEGVTLDAGSYPSREQAVETARGIANQLTTEGGEWPLVGDTLVRPEAVLAIEIESAVSWFSSRNA